MVAKLVVLVPKKASNFCVAKYAHLICSLGKIPAGAHGDRQGNYPPPPNPKT
jgi:hypothetical protein